MQKCITFNEKLHKIAQRGLHHCFLVRMKQARSLIMQVIVYLWTFKQARILF